MTRDQEERQKDTESKWQREITSDRESDRNTVNPNRTSRRVTADRNQLGRQSRVNCRSRGADQRWQDRPVMSVTLAGKEALSILTGRTEKEKEREREGRASKRHTRVGEPVARGLRRGTKGLALCEPFFISRHEPE